MDSQAALLSVADAASRLRKSTEQGRRYLREGRLEGRRIGGQWFIEATALGDFSSAQRARRSFLNRIQPSNARDPLATVIGIGRGGGSDIAAGKDAYRRAFWWRS